MHNDVIYTICDNTKILYVVHEDVEVDDTIILEAVIEDLEVVYNHIETSLKGSHHEQEVEEIFPIILHEVEVVV